MLSQSTNLGQVLRLRSKRASPWGYLLLLIIVTEVLLLVLWVVLQTNGTQGYDVLLALLGGTFVPSMLLVNFISQLLLRKPNCPQRQIIKTIRFVFKLAFWIVCFFVYH